MGRGRQAPQQQEVRLSQLARHKQAFMRPKNGVSVAVLQLIMLVCTIETKSATLQDRNFLQVYEMLEAQTNCTFLSLVSLVNYGNWCGPGSNGRDPVDDVDTCCQGHDMCYDTIDKSGLCDGLHPALVTYQFEPVVNGTLACNDCDGEDLLNEERSDEEVACHCKTCSCDVELAACIAASGHCAPPLLGITEH